MAEESDLSRTEPASPRRLQQARSEGDVPRSAELTAWAVLLTALGGLVWLAPSLFDALSRMLQTALQTSARDFSAHPFAPFLPVTLQLLPLLGLIFVALLATPMLLSGWVFAPRALTANFRRLHPLAAFRRLFSSDGVFAAGKTLLKFAAVTAACWLTLSNELGRVLPGAAPDPTAAAAVLMKGLLSVAGALLVFALADGGWQWWRYRARHAMSWQEVLAEARESEGSPEMRARMHARQQAAGQAANAKPKAVDE